MWEIVFASFVIAFTAFYLYVRHKMTFWERRGIPSDPGTFPFGSKGTWDLFSQKIAFAELTDHAYNSFPDAPLVGCYGIWGDPYIVIRDLDLAKLVLVKNFDTFIERKPLQKNPISPHSKNNRYIQMMLTELRGQQWKTVRSSLTPIFTSGKLKAMVPLIHKIADHCDIFLEQNIGQEIEGKELMKNFALDVIVSTGFGYESDSINEPENMFKTNANTLLGKTMTPSIFMKFMLYMFWPSMFKWLDMDVLDRKSEDFFAAIVLKAMKDRQESGLKRNDFIDTCIDILKKEISTTDGEESTNDTQPESELKKDEVERIIIANSLVMFLAGFDTASTAASMMLYNLAKNQDYQERLYQEIQETMESTGSDQADYTTIMNMTYMEQFFQESLRMYPLTHLERASINEFKVPGTEMVIPKDVYVYFAQPAVVKDEKYFPNPKAFNPDNFSGEKKAERHPFAYGGFGHGPRNCIAQRFATMKVKIIISRILSKYRIVPCSKTIEEVIPDPLSLSQDPKGSIWISIEKR
ncbi:cytochrome P450 6B7-like [Clytia hemisphaerica]|uniref:cytochrome P450 6B7-like n=1 Tax=Clytia hemisphaerica TaxID=252671 RepID=UPI0034D639E7